MRVVNVCNRLNKQHKTQYFNFLVLCKKYGGTQGGMTPFAGCYLLHSKHPQSRGRSYIG